MTDHTKDPAPARLPDLVETDIDAFLDLFFRDVPAGFRDDLRQFMLHLRQRCRAANTILAYARDPRHSRTFFAETYRH